jgi:eukaryotic-like serine/threonine-protein kinase
LHEGTVIAGKYRLERPLARGGMGAVWVARHLQLDEAVAVKFMDVSLPAVADARVRFEREAKSAARIRSPHVVQILDHGVDGEMPYIVMELLEGEHLGTRLKRESRLCLSSVAVIAEQVAKALHRAHRAGIVHRDLKPANVFLARVDDDEIVKILDFGIVKAMGGGGSLAGEATKSDVLMGSPNYMSPEQARGARTVDHRTDLWSLAVVLFRAITGKMAFSGDSVVDVILKICTGPIPIPTTVAPDLPPEVDAFFERALERDPARRFSSAREMGGEFVAMVRALGPKADHVGPIPTTAAEPQGEQAQSSTEEVASGDIVVSSAPGSPDGTFRWRQLLQGAVDTPTIPHTRGRVPSAAALSVAQTEAKSASAAPSSGATTLQKPPQKEASTPLATLLKPPTESQPMSGSLATLLRPPSGSPANAASALLKPLSPIGKAGTTPLPPTVKGHLLVKSATSSVPVFTTAEPSAPQDPEGEGAEPSAFIRLTSAGSSANKMPQSDRSAEIAQFIDQAFLALQASDPLPQGMRSEPATDSHTTGGLIKLGPPSWPAGPSGTAPVVASLLGKSGSSPPGGSSVAALLSNLSKSSSNPISPRASSQPLETRDSTPPPTDEPTLTEPALSPEEASRIKAQRAAHADRISKLVDEGFAALKRGDRTLARACWSEALSLDPTDRMLKLNLRKLDTKGRP